MKRKLFAAVALLCVLLCSCARVGEMDSLDFYNAMEGCGYSLAPEEISSGERLREGCYVDGCKLSLFSTSSGKLYRVSVTYAGSGDYKKFASLALGSIQNFCGYSPEQAQAVLNTLNIGYALPGSTKGVARCAEEWFSFSFTCDSVGGVLVIDSLRLNPTVAPTVTVRTTVPLPEKPETRP